MLGGGLTETFLNIRPALLRFLVARGASPAEAEDILQDMSLKLAEVVSGPVGQPKAYLYKMASNQFQLHRRGEGRRSRRESDWVNAQSGQTLEIDPQPTAEQRLIDSEQLEILRATLERLPDRTRWIFSKFRIDGNPQKKIAQELGISVSAVEKHLTRAYEEIARVRHLLNGERPEPRHLGDNRGRYGR